MGLFDLFKASKEAKRKIKETAVAQNVQQNQNISVGICGKENPNYVSNNICDVHKRDTIEIRITSRNNAVVRDYLHCELNDDKVFKGVTMAGAKISSISMTEVHDWDDREWYQEGFSSYEAYLQDEEHDKYVCQWIATAEYSGVAITFSKPYNQISSGLWFSYDDRHSVHLAEFFEKFDEQFCKKKTVFDEKKSLQLQNISQKEDPATDEIKQMASDMIDKDSTKAAPKPQKTEKEDKLVFVRETQYCDEKDFWHYSEDTYFLTTQNQIIKKTSSTIADAHNVARNSKGETSYKTSLEELNVDMHAFDHRIGTLKDSNFNSSLVRVLTVHYKEGVGFEKTFERKAILLADGRYYLQKITRRVTAEGNGRPMTQCSEYVYPISTANIDEITPKEIEKYTVLECVYQDVRSNVGVGF